MSKRRIWLLILVVTVLVIGVILISMNRLNSGGRYSVNQYGETYGPHDPDAGPENFPDLIAAIGDNGIEGYLKYTDFIGPPVHSPEEAAVYQETKPSFFPLYDKDGRTVIDTFSLRAGEAVIKTTE